MRASLPITLMLLAFSCGNACAGVVLTFSRTDLATKKTTPMTIYADPDKLTIANENETIVYREDQKRFWIIDAARKNYTEVTQETIQQLTGQVTAMQAQMQARMAGMPPAQRAQMEAMMAGLGMPGAGAPAKTPQVNYAKLGPAKRVANIPCNMYGKTTDGEHSEDLCIATIAAAGITTADVKVLDSLGALVDQLATIPMPRRDNEFSWSAMNRAIGFTGIPLETTDYSAGKPASLSTVQKIERTTIPASTFEVPAGFTRQTLPTGR